MHFSKVVISVLALCASAVSAVDHIVKVGAGGLAFDPTSVTVAAGDTVSFQFQGKNHSVTQSSFTQPCTRLNANGQMGVDSGFVPVSGNTTTLPQWSFTVNNATAPLWFYCAQKSPADHCAAGMVFAINPTADKTFDAFQAAAKGSATSSSGTGTSTGTPSSTPSGSGALKSMGMPIRAVTALVLVAAAMVL